MNPQIELVQQAKLLTKDKRQAILTSYPEVQLHKHLKSLFNQMEPNYRVAVTHGANEFGKDLVIVKIDNLGIDVTAVVVKVGDIKGKTSGNVDEVKEEIKTILRPSVEKKIQEIASQVDQALEHPAEIPTIFNQLPVTKVMVIVAGSFSNQARRRLVEEVKLNVIDIHDIDWLIDKFTEHYPQVFFEQAVIDFLQTKIQQLEEQHWLGGKHINLSDYYVDPVVIKTPSIEEIKAQPIDALLKKKKLGLANLKAVTLNNSHTLLAGDPSTGKSGAVIKLAIEMLREAAAEMLDGKGNKGAISVPILLTARQLVGTENIQEIFNEKEYAPELRGRIAVKLLIMDGLDEVLAERRQEALDKAMRYATELKANLLVTSRKIDLLKTAPKGFSQFELLPFQPNQAIKLFEKLTGNNADKLKALRLGLEKFQFKVPMVPLSLIFLLELVEERKEVPASVTELYERFSDIALGRNDKEKGIEVLFEYLIKKRFLSSLGFRGLLSRQRLEMPREQYEAFIREYAAEFDWDDGYILTFSKEIERTGILHIGETVLFKHRSFLEYYSGFYIHDQRDSIDSVQDFIVKIYFDDNWGDASFFAIGLRREFPEQMIDKFFGYAKDDTAGRISKLSIGRLLQAGWHSRAAVTKRCIRSGISFLPQLRTDLREFKGPDDLKLPYFFIDLFLLGAAEACYASGFLFKELHVVLEESLADPTSDKIFQSLFLLFALRDLLSENERGRLANEFLSLVETHGTIDEQVRYLPFLTALKKDDQAFMKKIRSRCAGLLKKYPDLRQQFSPASPGRPRIK